MDPNNYYQVYINSVLQLAATIVVKSAAAADAVNFYTANVLNYPLDELDPTTWKYYMNLAGQYHPTDTVMTVTSMDTLETIDFTVENLQTNLATAAAYAYGTYQYNQLVQRYPTQVNLILGILYPVNINTAIAAPDGQILGYPAGLVEPNEYSLIPKLQNWINEYKARWVNIQFTITDSLYLATSLGIMFLMMFMAIINIRLRACKTREAHSFHVREYLASHGLLDQYISQMTLEQSMFFYRNIAYIERNPGKQSIFEWLVENIMTVRNLPLTAFMMKHDISAMPENVYPNITIVKVPVNDVPSLDTTTVITLSEALALENPLALDNATYEQDYLPVITQQFQDSMSNSLKTKILESEMIDYSENTPYTLPDILVNHWLWLAQERKYIAYVTVDNPATGEEISLPALDAFILMYYVFCKANGVALVSVPELFAKRVQRIPTPPVSDLMSVVDTSLVEQSIAQQALSSVPTINLVISREAFYQLCFSIYTSAQEQRGLTADMQDFRKRGMVQNMVDRIYTDEVIQTPANGQTFAAWFEARNMDLSALTQAQLTTLYTNLLSVGTAQDLNPVTSLSALQTAMVKLLGQLSSYTIQIIGSVNSGDFLNLNWTAVRLGNIKGASEAAVFIDDMVTQPIDVSASSSATLQYDVNPPFARRALMASQSQSVQYDLGQLIVTHYAKPIINMRMDLGKFGPSYQAPLPTNTEGIIPVLGIESYIALNAAQRASLKFVYNS